MFGIYTQLGFNIAVTTSGAPAGNGMVQLFDGATLWTTVLASGRPFGDLITTIGIGFCLRMALR